MVDKNIIIYVLFIHMYLKGRDIMSKKEVKNNEKMPEEEMIKINGGE